MLFIELAHIIVRTAFFAVLFLELCGAIAVQSTKKAICTVNQAVQVLRLTIIFFSIKENSEEAK